MTEESKSSADPVPLDPVPLDIQTRVEVTRLHCVHLRMLLEQLESKLTTIAQALGTDGNSSLAIGVRHLNELEQQSEFIALETERLQGFVHCLDPQRPGT
jgi:hypothetical protein